MKSDAFQGQSPLGSACNAVECASEGLTLFFANASLFIGMTPAGASIVRIDRRLNRVPFEAEWIRPSIFCRAYLGDHGNRRNNLADWNVDQSPGDGVADFLFMVVYGCFDGLAV